MKKANVEAVGSAELRAGETRVVIAPALGGKITALEMAGRQWLWQNDLIPARPPTDDDPSYAESGDSGGYDECFPTVGACTLPTWIPSYGGLVLPDHGELWSQSAAFLLETQAQSGEGSGLRATCTWHGRRMPYRFERTVFVDPAGALVLRYAVTNEGTARLPFVWCAHPLFPLTPDTRLVLPESARVRVYTEHGIKLFGSDAEHVWPRLLTPAGVVDMSRPYDVAKRFACKLFLDMKGGYAAIEEEGVRLEVTFDASEVPNFGLWINKRGWAPFRRKRPYVNFAFEPSIGAPDTVSDALGGWNSAHWLEGGETRRWGLRWRGERLISRS
ncbi:MAG TPA: hypothetical protein VFJ96_05355 [Gemmatimonadaceae bacterium]|nr:hypothetical protein [Gemmatimonadaceae bacterium]